MKNTLELKKPSDFVLILGGGDWYDASVETVVLLYAKKIEDLMEIYKSEGGYYKTKKIFKDWLIYNKHARDTNENDYQFIEEDF